MSRALVTTLLLLAALPPTILALTLVLGAGVIRQGSPVLVAFGAGALVVMPALGFSTLSRVRLAGLGAGMLLWSLLVITGFPLYFPGERVDALAAGASVVAAPFQATVDPAHVIALEASLPELGAGRLPPPRAEVVAAPPRLQEGLTVPSIEAGKDGVVLPFEGQGRSMSVPVTAEGPGGQTSDLWMLFDTGATLTTLPRSALAKLGIEVPRNAPEVTLRTAAGERVAQVVLLNKLWVGGLEVDAVTVAVCEECADNKTAGLLGLNVSGRFRVTVDSARRELVLQPREGPMDQSVDLSPWLQIKATAVHWSDGRIEVELSAANAASRPVTAASVEIRCSEIFSATLHDIPAGGERKTSVSLPLGTNCDGYSVVMSEGRW